MNIPSDGWVDLHTHTHASDGQYSPRELVRRAAEENLSVLAVTDHDTISGLPEAMVAGQEQGVMVIPGCEIGAGTPYGEMHIVGLNVPLNNERLNAWLVKTRRRRVDRVREFVERLGKQGVSITFEDVMAQVSGESPGRQHIANALVRKGYARNSDEAFGRYLNPGAAAYVPHSLPEPEEALSLLRDSGAVSVFAHPFLLKAPADWLEGHIGALKECGLDAIEAYHSWHTPSEVRDIVLLAQKYGLALSGGSDFHGDGHSSRKLGRGAHGMRLRGSLMSGLNFLLDRTG